MKFIVNNRLFILIMFLFLINAECKEPKSDDPPFSVKNKVDKLLSTLSLEEKVGQMCQYVGIAHMKQVEEWHLADGIDPTNDAYGFYKNFSASDMEDFVKKGLVGSFLHVSDWQEANELQKLAMQSPNKIPLLIATDAIHGHGMYVRGATVFPGPIGLSSTWDTSLVREIARVTAQEMRATGYHWTFSPNVDVVRDPRWGRVGETFGEDPYLVGLMGEAMVKGYQGNAFSSEENVIACAKHFLAGSQPLRGLNFAPMDVSERALYETWLPPFQKVVDAGVYTAMAAHNELNGVPCHSNKYLLKEVLRNELGFDGFVVSDWTDIARLHTLHKVAFTRKEADYLAVSAGIDMHMHGPEFYHNVLKLVKEGKIPEKKIDNAVKKILYAKFKLGLFENPYVNASIVEKKVLTTRNKNLALEAARKSVVLLKNQNNLLPLNKSLNSIFITGPNADNQTMLGDWAKPQPEGNVLTVKTAIEHLVSKNTEVLFQPIEKIKSIADDEIEEAVEKAKKAEVAIVVVGSNSLRHNWGKEKTCGENAARANLCLFGRQKELIQRIYATGTPTVVVLINGRPLSIKWCAKNIPAIIEAWEPGMFGGTAIAETIFGDNNPSGKLTISIPASVGQIPCFYNHKPSAYFRSYVDEETGTLFDFGHGLSYTTFDYSPLKMPNQIIEGESLKISVKVKNTGLLDGYETVIVYINDLFSSVTTPVKEMKAFKKIFLKKGEEKEVHFTIKPSQMRVLNQQMEWQTEPGKFEVMVSGQKKEFMLVASGE